MIFPVTFGPCLLTFLPLIAAASLSHLEVAAERASHVLDEPQEPRKEDLTISEAAEVETDSGEKLAECSAVVTKVC